MLGDKTSPRWVIKLPERMSTKIVKGKMPLPHGFSRDGEEGKEKEARDR